MFNRERFSKLSKGFSEIRHIRLRRDRFLYLLDIAMLFA
jgi:hypothetical protein